MAVAMMKYDGVKVVGGDIPGFISYLGGPTPPSAKEWFVTNKMEEKIKAAYAGLGGTTATTTGPATTTPETAAKFCPVEPGLVESFFGPSTAFGQACKQLKIDGIVYGAVDAIKRNKVSFAISMVSLFMTFMMGGGPLRIAGVVLASIVPLFCDARAKKLEESGAPADQVNYWKRLAMAAKGIATLIQIFSIGNLLANWVTDKMVDAGAAGAQAAASAATKTANATNQVAQDVTGAAAKGTVKGAAAVQQDVTNAAAKGAGKVAKTAQQLQQDAAAAGAKGAGKVAKTAQQIQQDAAAAGAKGVDRAKELANLDNDITDKSLKAIDKIRAGLGLTTASPEDMALLGQKAVISTRNMVGANDLITAQLDASKRVAAIANAQLQSLQKGSDLWKEVVIKGGNPVAMQEALKGQIAMAESAHAAAMQAQSVWLATNSAMDLNNEMATSLAKGGTKLLMDAKVSGFVPDDVTLYLAKAEEMRKQMAGLLLDPQKNFDAIQQLTNKMQGAANAMDGSLKYGWLTASKNFMNDLGSTTDLWGGTAAADRLKGLLSVLQPGDQDKGFLLEMIQDAAKKNPAAVEGVMRNFFSGAATPEQTMEAITAVMRAK